MNNSRLIIPLTLFVAIILATVPLPPVIDLYRPDWLVLVVIYWAMALPHKVSIGTAFLMGLMLDLLLGAALGLHALSLSMVTYVIAVNHLKVRNFSVWQQAIVIAMISMFYQLLTFWIQRFLTEVYFVPDYLWPALSNSIIWLWLFPLLRKIRRIYGVK